jgi:glycosyltransferase involved in cell wall biosynthesis
MKILQLCKKFPIPPKDGEAVAVLSLAKGYAKEQCDVSLLSMNTNKHYTNPKEISTENHAYKTIETVFLDISVKFSDAFFNLFTKKSYNIQRFVSKQYSKALIDMLISEDYDVVQFESLYLAPYIDLVKKHSKALIVMRSHNLEHEIWHNMADINKNIFLSWYYQLCSNRLKEYELSQMNAYDCIIAISDRDASMYKAMGYKKQLITIPVGIDSDNYHVSNKLPNPHLKLGYLGSLDWKPNIEGLNWFFKNAWPDIHAKYSDLEFHLAGRNPSDEIALVDYPQLIYHGEVESATAFISTLDIVIVPLLSGSGIRVKIIESMAMGKLVISTSKGFEGINITNGVNAEIIENKEDLMHVFEKYMNNPELIQKAGNMARTFVHENFDYLNLSRKALQTFNAIKSSLTN